MPGVRARSPYAFACWPKRCRCGASYWPGRWTQLDFVGFMEREEEPGTRLELRNCACGSTLSVVMGAPTNQTTFDVVVSSHHRAERLCAEAQRIIESSHGILLALRR